MKEKTRSIIFLITEKLGVPKSIVWGLISAIIMGAATLSYAFVTTTSQTNKEFPSEQKKQAEVEKEAKALRIDVEVIKMDGANTKRAVKDMKIDMKQGFDEIKQALREINRNTK